MQRRRVETTLAHIEQGRAVLGRDEPTGDNAPLLAEEFCTAERTVPPASAEGTCVVAARAAVASLIAVAERVVGGAQERVELFLIGAARL